MYAAAHTYILPVLPGSLPPPGYNGRSVLSLVLWKVNAQGECPVRSDA